MAAPTATRLGLKLPLTEEQILLCQAQGEHEQTMRQLRDNLSELRRNPPPPVDPEHQTNQQAQAEMDYHDSLQRAQLSIVMEDCCFHLPLGHDYGERDDNMRPDGRGSRSVEDWGGAPGVRRDN